MKNIILIFMVLLLGGCATTIPISERLSYPYEEKAASLKISDIEAISIQWIPESFPSRIDIQRPSGVVAAGMRGKIATGKALSNRITHILDEAIGIDNKSSRVLTITVLDAISKYKLAIAAGEGISYGESYLKAKFEFNGKTWEEEFVVKVDSSIASSTIGYRLEHAWDEVSLLVGKSIVNHLSK